MSTPEKDQVEEIRRALGLMAGQFKALFPTPAHVDRFIRVVMTAVQQNSKLTNPELRTAFYAACMKCAQDGLMPDGKEAALVPYLGRNPTVQYQPMVEGMMKKLRLSNEIVGAPRVHVVKERDEFDYQLGDEEKIVHKPALANRGKTVAAYSIVKLKSGDVSREYMPVDEIEAIRRRGRSPDEGPWVTDFDEMARKTVFRRHYKKLPKSSDLDNVLSADDETFVPFEQPKSSALALPAPGQAGGETLPPAKVEQRSSALQSVVDNGGQKKEPPAEPAAATTEPKKPEGGGGAAAGETRDIL